MNRRQPGRSPATQTVTDDRGSFTAELALGLPALMLLLLTGVGAVTAAITHLRCLNAAGAAARLESRDQPGTEAALRAAPPGATITVTTTRPSTELPGFPAGSVTVVVRAPLLGLGDHLPPLTVDATAVAALEPRT